MPVPGQFAFDDVRFAGSNKHVCSMFSKEFDNAGYVFREVSIKVFYLYVNKNICLVLRRCLPRSYETQKTK